jgi:hypothetical protein
VQCIYPALPANAKLEGSSTQSIHHGRSNGQDDVEIPHGNPLKSDDSALDPILELRLMHEWTSQVPQSFSTAWEFWQRQAPLVAFEHRYVLDSILCLAALHASRREPQQWLALEGRMAPTMGKQFRIETGQNTRDQIISPPWTLPSEISVPDTADVRSRLQEDRLALDQQRGEMLRVARIYFDRALSGQNKALPAIDAESGEACYLASICVSYAALFSLGEDQNEANTWLSDPIQWVRIAHGSRVVVSLWKDYSSHSPSHTWGVYDRLGFVYSAIGTIDLRSL